MAALVEIPILQVAASCGLRFGSGTARAEVQAECPFCGDSQRRLYLNTAKNVFHCQRCKASGNSITLYARLNGVSNAEAYRELAGQADFDLRPLPRHKEERAMMKPLEERSRIYSDMLQMLELLPEHRLNLQNRGLDMAAIKRNGYHSVPKKHGKVYSKALYTLSQKYDLSGVPGFYREHGRWQMATPEGFFVPVRDVQGRIQGLQIRLDNGSKQKYRWFSSNGYPGGTKCAAFLHVVGWKPKRVPFITEGALKADVASFLMEKDACFIALPGVGNMKGLESLTRELHISEVTEAFDMDKETNPAVRLSVERFYGLMEENGVNVQPMRWNPAYKGIDDMLLAEKGYGNMAA